MDEKSGRGSKARRGATRLATLAALTLTAATALLLPLAATASTPASGSLSVTSTTPLKWTGTALASGSSDESTCVEGVNCDTFTINVAGSPADWANKVINVQLNWTNQLNDYDLYIHKDSNAGATVGNSGSGAPSIGEFAAIDPAATGTGVYTVHVVYFLVVPTVDQYKATATVVPRTGEAYYLKGGIGFSPNVALKAPLASSDGEPSSRCDITGNYYVSGIRGVPAGCDLWYMDVNPSSSTFDPYLRNPIYRGQPDSFTADQAYLVGADGGGDVDLAVGFGPSAPGQPPTLAFSSLTAANLSSSISNDKGVTWQKNPVGNLPGGVAVDDRQWLEFYNDKVVYMLYRTFQPAVTQIQRSNDGGLTWGVAQTAGQIGQVGGCDVDKHDGTVWISGSTGKVAIGVPATPGAEPTSYKVVQVSSDPQGIENIFNVVKVADDGTAYVVYSNGNNVYLKYSKDKGDNWSPAVRVNDGPETKTAVLPCIETGPTPGSVAIAWYGCTADGNVEGAKWNVFMAQSLNANSTVPTFRQVQVSDHYIHANVISTGGTLGDANRNLLDYFQVSFDPSGAALIAYTDDHNDFYGHTYVARQVSGCAINGKKMKKQNEGSALPPKQAYSSDGSQVVDFTDDVTIGLLAHATGVKQLDIKSIKYSSETAADGSITLVATMKVDSMVSVQPQMSWRMNFAANAPGAGVNATGAYSNALNDMADQFYVLCSTDSTGAPAFTWGTVVRDPGGSQTRTKQGTCTGSIDTANGTVTVKVPVSALNAFVTHGPVIGSGTVLTGLMGSAFTSVEGDIISDFTRGGLEYTIP